MTLPWPESYQSIKASLVGGWQVKGSIEILREFSDGKSTARVYVVDLDSSPHRGLAILKLDSSMHWPGEPDEADRHRSASKATPDYSQHHLPRVLASWSNDGVNALLCSVAGDSFNYVEPLRSLPIGQQLVAVQQTIRGMLDEWNRDYAVTPAIAPCNILSRWLGYRIRPDKGGRIYDFLQAVCSLDPQSPAFSFCGTWFPNPYAYATSVDRWSTGHEIIAVTGRNHGDLHGHNILVRLDGPYSLNHFLIDLALYEENTYLFYDFAYLEVSHLLHYCGSMMPTAWKSVLDATSLSDIMEVDIGQTELANYGLLNVVRAGRQEVRDWIKRQEPNRQEHLEGQAVLARVASGLNFCNKVMDNKLRTFAFMYSAANLKQYLSAFHLGWEQRGTTLDLQGEAAPTSAVWRAAWEGCDHFEPGKNAYCLVCGPGVRGVAPSGLSVLCRIPWAIVLDLDPDSSHGGLLEAVSKLPIKRPLHKMLPDNLLSINFKAACCWLMAAGLREREDTVKRTYDAWRRSYLAAIREQATRLRKDISPQPVIVVFLSEALGSDYLRAVWECLDEVFGEYARHIVLQDPGSDGNGLAPKEGVEVVQCSVANFVAGLWQVYGAMPDAKQIRVPRRGATDEDKEAFYLEQGDCEYLEEDLEVIHAGLACDPETTSRIGHDFWRGNEITWMELDMGVDVHRELCDPIKANLVSRLKESRNVSVSLYHTPGAGATTLARRIAWDVKDLFPTVRIRHLSEFTASRIEVLFQRTKLPVLVVMESRDVPPPARERLYRDLAARNVRGVFLYIQRGITQRSQFSLQDPMVKSEASRFCDRYIQFAPPTRKNAIQGLVQDEAMKRYCSPFFFGLYAFEKEFVRVPDYVRANLDGIGEGARQTLGLIALISRYSQSALPELLIWKLIDPGKTGPVRLNEILGSGPSCLMLHRDREIRVVHPLIAEEVLTQVLTRDDPHSDAWRFGLADLSCCLIERLADGTGRPSTTISELFAQLFLSRDPWGERGDRRRNFSELILMIPNEAGQHRVLEKLRDCCPHDAHIWNHLGRHHIYAMRSNYEEAELCLKKAIELDEKNDIHRHALGMVYRYEIKRRLDQLIHQGATPELGLAEIQGFFVQATECFKIARDLGDETEYGYVTNIQLIIEIVQRLFRLSGRRTYPEFLGAGGAVTGWCREQLPYAENLLRRVKDVTPSESRKDHITACHNHLLECYGRSEDLIKNLTLLLNRHDIDHVPLRRIMADAYLAKTGRDWKTSAQADLRSILALMRRNIEEGIISGQDVIMWFQAYRRLEEFDMLEVIDRLSSWAMRDDVVEAWYYLYILHFLQWRQGILRDTGLIAEEIRRCSNLTKSRVGRDRCFEWLASKPAWCPLAHRDELGEWDHKKRFYRNVAPLTMAVGSIKQIKGPQSGTIAVGSLDVFFVPGNDYLPQKDENLQVRFYLGFSYEGLRGRAVSPTAT